MIRTPQRRTINGRPMVLLEEAEYLRLLRQADDWEPSLPEPDSEGNYPALETMAVIQARDILRERRRLGLTQAELARAAGIRMETVHRIETAKNKPNVRTMGKIDRALRRAARRKKEPRR